ncbi:hypothetical protein MLD38_021155 [Melastoma candidum]|uniref:Uncharacterized protein n=1 Tax=Melastoma candidum TaxID=119954 RepID=A0ACB9QFA1_9MYRT|nr:hypothetical protein MLD38_021155 [Melastoma candidum]
MGLQEIIEVARNLAVMVRVHGPDPRGMKMRRHAFHHYQTGKTTISASGMLVPVSLCDSGLMEVVLAETGWDGNLVVTVASVVEPFLAMEYREGLSKGQPELISGARIDVMVEDSNEHSMSTDRKSGKEKGSSWVEARLLTLVDVPESSLAIQSLVEASSSSKDQGWDIGWSLASNEKKAADFVGIQSQKYTAYGESAPSSLVGISVAKIAILGISILSKSLPSLGTSSSIKRGDFLLAVGSPFGILSPIHFVNSISTGFISNFYPPNSSRKSLLMADIRCLPGSEGGPVLDGNANLVGIMTRPLSQKTNGAEVQLLIPWDAISSACKYSNTTLKESGDRARKTCDIDRVVNSPLGPSQLNLEKAVAAVCLITVNDAVWASGVLLNAQGLILTNAHLLEPWRFGKGNLSGKESSKDFKSPFFLSNLVDWQKNMETPVNPGIGYRSHRNIQVRLDHLEPQVWCEAKVVYISKGPLDVALLQLVHVPDELIPIEPECSPPPLGSKVYVIGHGLFGPKSGLFPSVSTGVVAKVVKTEYTSSLSIEGGASPAMIETTAAVHPGASGGLVVNLDGHMIGLVTSNARHGGGTVIPHLNFNIPCAALAPIFRFSQEMEKFEHLQDLDRPNQDLSSIWALMPPLPPERGPGQRKHSRLGDEKEGRGSQFAKFLAENNIFTRPSEVDKDWPFPAGTIRGRL